MENCYIEFEPISACSLDRTNQIFEIIKAEKESGRNPNEKYITNSLKESEKSYFTNFTEEEFKEWNQFWFSTPIEIRHSANMPTSGWDLESMYDAFWSGEYQLIAIVKVGKVYQLQFRPVSQPDGGTGCMVALLESMGNNIIGIEDGTGYRDYIRPTNIWKPKS